MPTPNPWDYAEKSGAEHAHQTALFMWANMAMRFGLAAANDKLSYTKAAHAANNYRSIEQLRREGLAIPQLKWLHAIHNQGHGDAIRGAKAKAEGVKAGVADLFLPVPMRYYDDISDETKKQCGLYIELKVGNNKPSAEQLEFITDMRAAGYKCEIAWGWLEARNKILDYLGLPTYSAVIG